MAEHLRIGRLPEEALSAWEQLKKWLLEVTYQPVGKLKLCVDQTLVNRAGKLLEHLPDDIKATFDSDENDTRMIAIYFNEPDSVVPVQDGMNVLLIPMGKAEIGNKKLDRLEYLQLTREVPAEPGFYALLIMCKRQ